MSTIIKKAIIPAAGLGTQFLPATKAVPKEMIPIVDKPPLQYLVEECINSGITEILIILNRNKECIENYFDKSIELELSLAKSKKNELLDMVVNIPKMASIYYMRQKEPKGLGDEINCAKAFVGNEPFAVLLSDYLVFTEGTPCIKQLIECYSQHKSPILGVQKVPKETVNKYDIVSAIPIDEKIYKVNNIVEKALIDNTPSNIALMGRYILTPSIFSILDTLSPGVSGEIQLTDALVKLLYSEDIYAYNFQGVNYDIGDKLGYLKAITEYSLRDPQLSKDFFTFLKTIVNK